MGSDGSHFNVSLIVRGKVTRQSLLKRKESRSIFEPVVILHEWIAFYSAFLNIYRSGVLQRWHGWCHMKLLPSRRVLCTPYNHAPFHFMQSHIRMVHACLAVTWRLHFWQNDRDLLRATAVTRGWNGYRNVSTESLPWRRKISRHSCRDSNPRHFNQESGALTTELSPPLLLVVL